jgi:2-polyprenyl-3-methyl-5-hydroxy-6-metoxy-1,4-benzoquinol methylase
VKEYIDTNRRHWDELVPAHVRSAFYDVASFKAGRSTLTPIEREELGDVSGKSLLHLQCHFGMDTLSWAREGALVTGVDFSPEAVRVARPGAGAASRGGVLRIRRL